MHLQMVVVLVEQGKGGGGGGHGQSNGAHASLFTKPHTVEPQFNEVPWEWGNFLVISKTSISRIFGKH